MVPSTEGDGLAPAHGHFFALIAENVADLVTMNYLNTTSAVADQPVFPQRIKHSLPACLSAKYRRYTYVLPIFMQLSSVSSCPPPHLFSKM